jgi:DNA-binding NarL/FixJ family response regulator
MDDTTRTRMLIADDQVEIRSAMRLLLNHALGVTTVEEAVNASQALRMAHDWRPDIVLLDWELPGQAGRALVTALRLMPSGPVVVVLSSKPEARPAALDAGASAFVSKGDPPEVLLRAIGNHPPQDAQLPAPVALPSQSDGKPVDLVPFVDRRPHALRQDRRLGVVG